MGDSCREEVDESVSDEFDLTCVLVRPSGPCSIGITNRKLHSYNTNSITTRGMRYRGRDLGTPLSGM